MAPVRRYRQPGAPTRRISLQAPQRRPRAARGSARGSRPAAGSRSPARGPRGRRAESGWRSAKTNSSTAPPTPASAAIAARQRPRLVEQRSVSTWPAIERTSIGPIRFEPQRSCSLGTSVGVAVLLVAADRLVLDPVVGGERWIPQARRAPAAPRSAAIASSRPTVAGPRRRSRFEPTTLAAATAITDGSSNGSRAERSRSRASGSTAIASARRSGPRTSGVEASRPRARVGFGPEATSIEPSPARAATAHEVGPWISRPLRSAIPPRRKRSGLPRGGLLDPRRRRRRAVARAAHRRGLNGGRLGFVRRTPPHWSTRRQRSA